MTASSAQVPSAAQMESELLAFLENRVKIAVAPDTDLFASGAVNSMLSLELVVHLETTYDVAVAGDELNLDNFRTVKAMTALVTRLRAADGSAHAHE
ncbi:acyl carrier protein [Streptomyces sp. P1-3]|uniref:acyl carrier protein n=1 Tax=Streptomyces sp. P1-3 TaxID=3421658 RepID=UPI003D35B88B